MDFASYKYFSLSREDRILTIKFSYRNDALNPIGPDVEGELVRFFFEVSHDPLTNVVIITGGGRAFSAGGDMQVLRDTIQNPDKFQTFPAKALVSAILDCPKVVIAKVNGHAVGLGATIALLCDVVFAASHAKFGDPHVAVGFAAGDGGTVIWPQLVGYARAKEYLLTGDLMSADEADRIGLINHSVPADELDARVDAFARRIATGATQAIQYTKQAVNIGLRQAAASMMDAAIAYEKLTNTTRDHKEAVDAFLEKRKPVFTGE